MDIFYKDGMLEDAIHYVGSNDWNERTWKAFASRMAAQRTPAWSQKFSFVIGIVYKGNRGIEKESLTGEFVTKARQAVELGIVQGIFIAPQFDFMLYYYGTQQNVPIVCDPENVPKEGVAFDGSMSMRDLMDEVVVRTLIMYENHTKKYVLTTKANAEHNAALKAPIELFFKRGPCLVSPNYLLRQLIVNGREVYIRPKHCPYSHSTSLIMRHFHFPDLPMPDLSMEPGATLDMLLVNINAVIATNIEEFVTSRDAAAASAPTSKETQLNDWITCCNRCVQQLAEVQATLPSLYHFNEATRRQILDIVLRQACLLNHHNLLVQNNLCANSTRPPENFVGTGPVDYTFGSQCLVVSLKDKREDDDEGEEEDACAHVRAIQKDDEFNHKKSIYQALSQLHDLLHVPDVLEVERMSHAPQKPARQPAAALLEGSDFIETTRAIPFTYARRSASSIVTSGQRFRVFHIVAPTVGGDRPAVYYGGEYPLRVLQHLQDVGLTADEYVDRGTGRDSGRMDHPNISLEEVKRVMALLSLAGSGKLMTGDIFNA